jgi:hypothetical protein
MPGLEEKEPVVPRQDPDRVLKQLLSGDFFTGSRKKILAWV